MPEVWMNMDLTDLSIASAVNLIRRREISPRELVAAYLDRIEALNPSLNAYLTVTAETALESARAAEQAVQRGEILGQLHGIPLALKDLFETRGVRTTDGSLFYQENVPQQDAYVVDKLYSAGGILLGKLNMHEIALGVTNANPHYGRCANPWRLDHISGGSSGGSAAALSSRLCAGSLGSDTGGSIRIPASLCGVVGLKPTYGRVSLRGVFPLSWNLDHVGPMARNVRDVAILLQVIADYDPDDPVSVDVPVDDYLDCLEMGVRGWRVGLASGDFFEEADAEVLEAVKEAAQLFGSLGAHVHPVELPEALKAARANGQIVQCDAAAINKDRLESHPEMFGQDVRQRLQTGAAFPLEEYVIARRTQAELRRAFDRFFGEYDIFLAPTTPIPAPSAEGEDAVARARLLTRFTAPFNLTGLPALSMPCGFTKENLPVGLQIIAAPWDEARLLRAAYAYERETGWHRLKPELDRGEN